MCIPIFDDRIPGSQDNSGWKGPKKIMQSNFLSWCSFSWIGNCHLIVLFLTIYFFNPVIGYSFSYKINILLRFMGRLLKSSVQSMFCNSHLFQHSFSRAVVQEGLYFLATHTYIFTASIIVPPRMSSSVVIWTHISTLFWWVLYFVEVPKLPWMHFIPCKIPRHIWVTACNSLDQLMDYKDALDLWALKQSALHQMPKFNHSIHIIEDDSLIQLLLR